MLNLSVAPQTAKREESLGFDRRECRRARRLGCISVATKGRSLTPAPLIEHTTQGARVVINSKVKQNQRVDFRLTTEKGELDGYARIAWVSPLSNGCSVAGLEFIDFSLTTAGLNNAAKSA